MCTFALSLLLFAAVADQTAQANARRDTLECMLKEYGAEADKLQELLDERRTLGQSGNKQQLRVNLKLIEAKKSTLQMYGEKLLKECDSMRKAGIIPQTRHREICDLIKGTMSGAKARTKKITSVRSRAPSRGAFYL